MSQERQRKTTRPQQRGETTEQATSRRAEEAHIGRIDDLLDEIDTVLEENAEEFVKNYVQKGGE